MGRAPILLYLEHKNFSIAVKVTYRDPTFSYFTNGDIRYNNYWKYLPLNIATFLDYLCCFMHTIRGYIKVVGSGGSACKKIGWPDAKKCYRYQFRKDRTTGNHTKMLLHIYTSSFKIEFKSLPFATAYPRCSLIKDKTPNCMVITWRVYSRSLGYPKS